MLEEIKDIEKKYKSRFNYGPVLGTKRIIYYEDLLFYFLVAFAVMFSISMSALWLINTKSFPTPPNPDYLSVSNPFIHIKYWWMVLAHKIPYFRPYTDQTYYYYKYLDWLHTNNITFILTLRIAISCALSVLAGVFAILFKIENVKVVKETAVNRGMQIVTHEEAQENFAEQTKEEIKKTKIFCDIGIENFYSTSRIITHTLGFGASGSGKSQWLERPIKAGIKAKVKCIILDAKYEFTQALYDPNDPTMAILDATDSRSHVWDMARDLNTISKKRRFASNFIVSNEGDNAMWGNAARMLFVGAMVYLEKKIPKYVPRDITEIFSRFDANQYYFIMKKYFPSGLDAVGQLGDDGLVEENVTNYGVKLNLKGYIDGLVDLGRFWHDEKQKKISLFEFMTDPNYPIKTLFIKPNDDERLMSSGLIRAMLSYMISCLDTPNIANSKKLQGIFFLDEFQAPGKLVNEEGKPVINTLLDRGRSKGWGAMLFVQDLEQLKNTYTEADVKQWRGVVSNTILTGTSPGDTAQMVSDMIGKSFFDKLHRSYGFDPQTGKRKVGDENMQEHEQTTILPTEIAGYLKPTDGNIRFLLLGRGLKNAFIFEKPIEPLEEIEPAWLRQEEDTQTVNPNCRILKIVEDEMKEDKTKAEEKIAKSNNTKKDNSIGKVSKSNHDEMYSLDFVEEINYALEEVDLEVSNIEALKSLADDICDELFYDAKKRKYIQALVDGKYHKFHGSVINPILKRFGESKEHKPLIDELRKMFDK